MAALKARTAEQDTATLCEVIVLLSGMPRTDETNLTRAVVTDVLCERHPEAMAAAEAWVDSDDDIDMDAVVADAALTAIGA
jgi:hypothetical protein